MKQKNSSKPLAQLESHPAMSVSIGAFVVLAIVIVLMYHPGPWEWEGMEFTGASLWDWLGLLIVPAAIGIGGFSLNRAQQWRDLEAQDRQAEHAALRTYLERMGDLLLNKKLRVSGDDSDVRKLARSWTVTTLEELAPPRKRRLLRFLYESDLIKNSPKTIIKLERARLEGADLESSILTNVNLKGAFLKGANLRNVDLTNTDLTDTDLTDTDMRSRTVLDGADMSRARLYGADLRETEGLTQEQIEQAIGDETTKLPEGLEQPESWAEGENQKRRFWGVLNSIRGR